MIKRILLLATIALISFSSYANTLDMYLMGGPAFSRLSNNTAVQINDFLVNDYFTRTRSQTEPLLGFGVGRTFIPFSQPLSLTLGLSAYYTNYGTVKGSENPFANDGIYDALNYKFRAQSYSLMLESRLIYSCYDWQPFVFVGVGCAWNRLYGYSETPATDPLTAATAQDTFSHNTNSAFAYEAGIGIQRHLFTDSVENIQYFASLDYRYLNFGKGELGTAPSQTTNQTLNISNLHSQAVVLSLKATI
jgi:opacity protein-like surface antigen